MVAVTVVMAVAVVVRVTVLFRVLVVVRVPVVIRVVVVDMETNADQPHHWYSRLLHIITVATSLIIGIRG